MKNLPKKALVYLQRGEEYMNKEDYDKAIVDYNQAIRLDPNDEYAKENLEEAQKAKMGRSN